MSSVSVWLIVLCVTVIAIAYVFWNYARIKKLPEGTAEMSELAGIIRSGAETFLKTEFKYIGIVLVIVAVVFCLVIEKTSGISFLIGGGMSSLVCILGMKSATYANVRTSNKARESLSIGETVKVALCGGSISGLAVQAFGMFGLILVLLLGEFVFKDGGVSHTAEGRGFLVNLVCNPTMIRISTYSLGCSIVAMFNRVAGGNYTKAADISSDILGKLRHDLPEDDSRIPNTIADFIGDNVNDIAGNCSDLLESFVATMSASIMISVTLFKTALAEGETQITDATFNATVLFPVILAGCGLVGCLIGLGLANIKKMGAAQSFSEVLLLISSSRTFLSIMNSSSAGLLPGFHPSWESFQVLLSVLLLSTTHLLIISLHRRSLRCAQRVRLSLLQRVTLSVQDQFFSLYSLSSSL